jgi:hypothetical protein
MLGRPAPWRQAKDYGASGRSPPPLLAARRGDVGNDRPDRCPGAASEPQPGDAVRHHGRRQWLPMRQTDPAGPTCGREGWHGRARRLPFNSRGASTPAQAGTLVSRTQNAVNFPSDKPIGAVSCLNSPDGGAGVLPRAILPQSARKRPEILARWRRLSGNCSQLSLLSLQLHTDMRGTGCQFISCPANIAHRQRSRAIPQSATPSWGI